MLASGVALLAGGSDFEGTDWVSAIGKPRIPSMKSLDIFSVRALMQALEQIHSTKDLCDLHQVLFSTLKNLIPGAMVTFDQLDLKIRIATAQISQDSSVGAEVKTRVLEDRK